MRGTDTYTHIYIYFTIRKKNIYTGRKKKAHTKPSNSFGFVFETTTYIKKKFLFF